MATEKRLIDPNEFLNRLENTVYDTPTDFGYTPGLIKTVLAQTKTVDAVEVVRCRECTNGYESSGSSTGMRCKKWGCYDTDCECRPSDFCSYGERRADGP